jgi:thiamine-phosphate pyrophosphorylase
LYRTPCEAAQWGVQIESRAARFATLLRSTRVYAVTDDSLPAAELLGAVRGILRAGVRLFQFRDKHLSDRARVELGRELTALVNAAGGLLIVNDRADIARAADADGVHLGQDDLPVEVGRLLVGEDRLVGASASYLEEIPTAEAAGADYLGFGAVYATGTKPDAELAGLDLLEQAARFATKPIVGIGGISIERARAVLERGVDGVAVVSALFRAADPEEAARKLLIEAGGQGAG